MASNFISRISEELLTSNAGQRLNWANEIVKRNVDLTELHPILLEDSKISMRCLWLLGHIADQSPKFMHPHLHELFKVCSQLQEIEISASFSKFWFLCSIPEEDEVIALDLLFKWLNSSKTNVTTKSRALFALNKFVLKYPEIKSEFISLIENQLNKNSSDFKKRATKILKELN